jgi:hypothetical protein
MRFFAKRTSGWLLDSLNVEVSYETGAGQVASLPAGGTWQPTLPFPGARQPPAAASGRADARRLPVHAVGGGTWQIDDVYVDPWRSR